jgi:eukaryotic-like serine/threonine-protein kinase
MSDGFHHRLQAELGPHFRLERELGGGGMSRVFVAVDTTLGREVVVKVLPPELAAEISVERFRREIQFAARLQHAHIVPLLTSGEADDLLYYTMPLVRGETLRSRLARVGELPLAVAVNIMRDVAKALAYAHAEGVIHRDIKPENILLTEHDALVTDFGVSKAVSVATVSEGLTMVGVALGTPAYMAPEQAAADPNTDQRADLYAFGAVAYEMLAGTAPFSGRSPQALLAAHVTETPESLARRRPAVPSELATLIMRCLEKRPADRPQSADDILRALEAVAISDAGTSRSVAARLPRRRNTVVVAIATVVLLGTIAAVVTRRSRPQTPIDQNAIAVLPFRITGSDSSVRPLREGMLDLVAATLTGRIHAVDTRTVLNAWRHSGGGATTDLSRDASISLGRELGAGSVLEGDIVGTNGELIVNGTLLSVSGGAERRASVRGAPARLAGLVESLLTKLVVLGAGEGEERASSLSQVPIAAVQNYLLGRDLDRRGRYTEATDAYARALSLDSTFALAGLHLWITASNWFSDPRAQSGRKVATQFVSKLGERDRLLLGPTVNPDRPRTCAEDLASQERAVAIAPDMPDLWYMMGETITHCGRAMGMEDANRRGVESFNRAIALDSSYTPAYEHLPIGYDLLGDSVRAKRSMDFLMRDSTQEWLVVFQFMSSDTALSHRATQRLLHAPFGVAATAVFAAMNLTRHVDEADAILEHVRETAITAADRTHLAILTHTFALNRGQPARASAALRAPGVPAEPALTLLSAALSEGDSSDVPGARTRALAELASPAGDSTRRERSISAIFAFSISELVNGDTTHARRAIAWLRAVPADTGSPWTASRPRRLALLLDAQLAQLARRTDAPTLLAAADSMLREGPGGEFVESAGNLVASNLWKGAGDPQRAYGAARRIRTPSTALFYSTYLRLQGDLGAQTGHRDEAIDAYRGYLALRSAAEPSLAAHLRSVRAGLARLEQSDKGR